MDMQEIVTKAYDIAIAAHHGQTRRDGKTPYYVHPVRVMERIKENGYDLEYQAVALLHDVLEDTEVTVRDLLLRGIPEHIIHAVIVLTKDKELSYETYLGLVKRTELARVVKIADMIDNLADKPSKKQIIKYAIGLQTLTED